MTIRIRVPLVMSALVALGGCGGEPAATDETSSQASLLVPHRILVPIGGGYDSIGSFARVVANHAHGSSVDILTLPPAYAEDQATAIENGDYQLAMDHVASMLAACEAVVDKTKFPEGCHSTFVELWTVDDANSPVIAEALAADTIDGYFFLGGDQGWAMDVVAGTLAEQAIAAGFQRGAIVSGTSAGEAIQSRVMNNGYTNLGDYNACMLLGSLDIWWGDASAPLHRGLTFGTTWAIFDQHLYERGRFGRFINETARTVDHFGHGGLVGMGADRNTGFVLQGALATDFFGPSSVAVADYSERYTSHTWVDANGEPVASPSFETTPTAALSARNIVTHLLAGNSTELGSAVSYNLFTRTASFNGVPFPAPRLKGHQSRSAAEALRAPHPILLAGDLSMAPGWPSSQPALVEFVDRAGESGSILIVAAAYDTETSAQEAIAGYAQALALSGWQGAIAGLIHPSSSFDVGQIEDAAGVIFLGGNQALLGAPLGDPAFTAFVRRAVHRAPMVMLERAMTAAAGTVYDAIDDASDSIQIFTQSATLQPGLGLFAMRAAFEPRLQEDYRYGRLYSIPFTRWYQQRPAVFGISEATALLVERDGATVLGRGPVLVTNSTWATFYQGQNGAIGGFNVLLDVFEPGEKISAH